ncbi:acyltransferase [Novosphingobium sp. FKTRR1]|uniref:acyltransferase family protein n=1 Tax=Novosphingobium sp. FKTRR1 TaxID=2879118 RepID=UPI001CF0A32E|nr:acyltransferase [Novosphingobium sp. FKTRR1]
MAQGHNQHGQSDGARLVVLDGLRGIAALMVLMVHFEGLSGETWLFERCYLSVDFFFMLSGFVLTPMIENGASSVRQATLVMARRCARLWPLIGLGALFGTISHALLWGWPKVFDVLVLAMVGLPRIVPDTDLLTYPLNAPQWSLVVELAINALHLAVLRYLPTRTLVAISGLCWIVLAIAAHHFGSLQIGAHGNDWAFGFVRAGFAYPLGIALARNRGRLTTGTLPWWTSLALLPALLLVPKIARIDLSISDPVVIALFAGVLALGAAARPTAPLPRRLTWLGEISFPLYAVHFPILELVHIVTLDLPVAGRALALLAGLGMSFCVANVLAKSPFARGIRLPADRLRALNAAT